MGKAYAKTSDARLLSLASGLISSVELLTSAAQASPQFSVILLQLCGRITSPASAARRQLKYHELQKAIIVTNHRDEIRERPLSMGERFRWDGEPLTLEQIDAIASELRKDEEPGTARFNYIMHSAIIRYFLGDEWWTKHAHLDAHPDSFLRPNFSSSDVDPRYSIMTLELAEMFVNLQFVRGFRRCLDNMSLAQLESGLAELQVGQILRTRGVPFKYVEEADGTTVDIVFRLPDGATALCEIKCKSEQTDYTEGTIKDALATARKQIGKGNAGVVFVKVPVAWVDVEQSHPSKRPQITLPTRIIAATKNALRGTSRIKKVIFYVFQHAYDPTWGLSVTHTTMEVDNPHIAPSPPWATDVLGAYRPGDWLSMTLFAERWAKQG